MDFAALMAAEIAKSKPGAGTAETKPSNKSKYMSKREAEAEREAAYHAEQAALEARRQEKAAEKRKRDEDEAEEQQQYEEKRRRLAEETRRRREEKHEAEERARRRRLGLPDLPPKDASQDGEGEDGDGNGEVDIPDGELVDKLRALGEPVKLFGESHRGRLKRYRRLTTVVTSGPIPTTLELVEEKDMKVCEPEAVPPASDKAGRHYLFRQLASYFTMVLQEWEVALAREQLTSKDKGDEALMSYASKAAVNAMVSSRENMRPLFRKFEKADVPDDILKPVVEIVRAAQERRYVDANDGYLRVSIGKAAWPIGVTMVGIHERSAREKLHNGERGHVMGDELTRKYLQSIKRCLTFAQVRWPPSDIRQLMG
ncbi:pre-mRNA-splicing factor 18 [Microdochium nivale]|nr:pre-mRNA-splicing factor 18 [Microdochium nivale]